jgi:hypothetical protein
MRLFEQIVAAQRKLESLGGILVFCPSPATTDEWLCAAEKQLGLSFAPSHRRFLERHNGCEIKIMPDRGEYASGIEIFDTHSIVERTLSYRRIYNKPQHVTKPPFWRKLVIIGRGDSGDYVLADAETPTTNSEYPILDGFSEDPPSWRSRVIANSFSEWIDRIFASIISNGKAPQYWVAEDETIAEAFVKWPRIATDDTA